jgi:hypothetical protein
MRSRMGDSTAISNALRAASNAVLANRPFLYESETALGTSVRGGFDGSPNPSAAELATIEVFFKLELLDETA